MSKSDDDMLSERLGSLGAQGVADGLGGLGVSAVVGWAARRLPNDTYELVGEVSLGAAAVSAAAINAIQAEGKVQDAKELAGIFNVRGIVGAGFFNMNPAVVTIQVQELTTNRSRITVRGTAKEGLIKQRSGEKAATRILRRLLPDEVTPGGG